MSLLTYSRKSTDELEFVSINELVTATLNFGRNEIRGEDIQIVEKLESTGKVRANANQLQQVIFNLLLNAKQAIARSGVLTVVTKETESHVVLKIGDTGVGIEINDMKRIFDPFFSTKGVWGEGKSQGTGLGLFICKNILSKIGAEISVQSKLGLGTTFTVKIPVSGEKAASGKLPTGLRNVVVASINAGLIKRLHRIVESDSTVTFSVADADDFERVAETIEAEASLVLVDLNGLHPLDAEAIIERVQLHAFKSLIITGQGSALPANISPNQLSVTAANPPDLDTIVAAFLARPGSPQPASNSR
jgi:hypothetical protein